MMGNVLRFWFLAELLIYKTIYSFRSQCHIFRFGNIAYCYEIDRFLTKTLLIFARSAYSLTKTLPIVARLAYSWPKHRDWHFEVKKGGPGWLFWFPRVFTDPTRVPPGFHRGVRAMDWPLPGRVWEVSGRGPLSVTESFYRKRRKGRHKDVPRGTPTRSTARRASADPSAPCGASTADPV